MAVKKSQSPVVSAAVTRLYRQSKAKNVMRWGIATAILMILLATDMYLCVISNITQFNCHVIWTIEAIFLLILFLCAIYDFVYYLNVVLFVNTKLDLTTSQKTMLGVPSDMKGLNTVSTPLQFNTTTPTQRIKMNTPPIATPFTVGSSSNYYYHHRGSPGSPYLTPSNTPSSFTPNRSPAHHGLSPGYGSDKISSVASLDQYLKSEEDKNTSSSSDNMYYLDQSSGHWYGSPSSYGSPGTTPTLRKYHVATRSRNLTEDDSNGRERIDSIWNKLNIKQDQLSEWTGRCRRWIAQTVLVPVHKEIKQINGKLKSLGSTDVIIGVASLNQLQEVARMRSNLFPSLNMLLRYLEVSQKQDYLVKRIEELAEGSSISNYNWSGGGLWKGRKWGQDLPSDSQFPDGKTFSSQYLLKAPDPPSSKKANLCLYQSSINPPCYKVLWKQSTIEIPQGRNNLFHCFIVFLYYIRKEEKRLLGHVDLELSGLKLLWIIGDA